MNKMMVVLATLTIVGVAQAQDTFGIYFDQAGTEHCKDDGVGQVLDCYLIVHNPSQGVSGFQGTLYGGPGVSVFDLQFPVANINVGVLPEILVGFASPLSTAPNLV